MQHQFLSIQLCQAFVGFHMIQEIFSDCRVEEMNWRQWRSDLGYIQEEDPGDRMMKPQLNNQTSGKTTDCTQLAAFY